MARHFLVLKEAATMPTREFQLTQKAVNDLIELQGMGAIYGNTGLGKTFSVEYATERIKTVPVVWMQYPSTARVKDVIAELVERMTGIPHDDKLRRLTALLRSTLSATPRLVVIDEAQNLTSEAIGYLRYLWDCPETCFALLFVGGNGCWDVLSREPMLRTRIARRVEFKRLSEKQVLRIIPRYHRIYETALPEDILFVNDKFAHGCFRPWALFTLDAARLCQEHGRDAIDREIITNVFALHGGASDDD